MEGVETWAGKHKSIIFVGTAFVLAHLFNAFLIWYLPGIAVLAFTILVCGAVAGLAALFKKPIPRDVALLMLLAVIFAGMVAVRSNGLLTWLNVLATCLLLLMVTEVNIRGTVTDFLSVDFLKVLGLPLYYLFFLIETVTTIKLPFGKPTTVRSKQIVRGILITVPIIIFFTALFAGADPVFHEVITAAFNIHFVSPEHSYIILMVFSFMCGALAYAFSKESKVKSVPAVPTRPMGHIETSILLGSVNVLFVIFITLQATYLFGGALNITHYGYTYAEYARRGFFELIAIATFTYLIMLATEKYIERDAERHSSQFKYLSTALPVQVMVLMVFAFNRLSLYEAAFGFTTLRLYSHAFIVLLAVVYLFLLYKIFGDTRESTFALNTFAAIAIFVLAMDILNPDAFIAQKNLDRYAATSKIDVWYLMGLSEDATSQKMAALSIPDTNIHGVISRSLYDQFTTNDSQPLPWQSWNLARARERNALESRLAQLSAFKDYVADPPIDSPSSE